MPEHEPEPEISILDQRLAEIDRRLSRIQVGLAEEVRAGGSGAPADGHSGAPSDGLAGAPSPTRPIALAPPPAADVPDDVDDPGLVAAELRGLVNDQAGLLDRLAELVAAGERLLAVAAAPPSYQKQAYPAVLPSPEASAYPAVLPSPEASVHAPDRPPPPAATAAGALTVAAGPFPSVDAVRAFERTLAALPGVDSAEVRGYESGDRAVVDVHLSPTTS
ncbi:MAG TPA: hypothetical protein VFN55_14300 [Solirubrobacteraceae bacterium]|nr:hypothetical protein [Solirubrobacteraceae bacterium]